MTVRAFMDRRDPTQIDLHNKIDPNTGIRYIGRAWSDLSGRWFCMADLGALCVVEIKLVGDPDPPAPLATSDPKEILRP